MKATTDNSYQANSFVNFQKENLRLNTQATLLYQLELELLKRHGLKEHQTVLDMGCGQGLLTHMIARYLTQGAIDGVDINAEFVQAAQQKLIAPNLTYYCAGILEYKTEVRYDFIYARFLFQHLRDPLAAILHLKSLLKPGGKLCIVDVNDEWLFVEPNLPAFTHLVNESILFQQKQGGDRLIAKRLPRLLGQAGFEATQLEIVPFSSALVGMEAFLDIAVSFRANYAYDKIDGQELYQTIRAILLNPSEPFYGLMGINCISAGVANSI